MKVFNFRLDAVLKLRKSHRDKALEALGHAAKNADVLRKQISSLEHKLTTIKAQISENRRNNFSGQQEESFQGNLKNIRKSILDVNVNLQNALKIHDAKRKIFIKADADHKSLLNLKEKKSLEFHYTESKKEELETDDIIGSRYVFNLNN